MCLTKYMMNDDAVFSFKVDDVVFTTRKSDILPDSYLSMFLHQSSPIIAIHDLNPEQFRGILAASTARKGFNKNTTLFLPPRDDDVASIWVHSGVMRFVNEARAFANDLFRSEIFLEHAKRSSEFSMMIPEHADIQTYHTTGGRFGPFNPLGAEYNFFFVTKGREVFASCEAAFLFTELHRYKHAREMFVRFLKDEFQILGEFERITGGGQGQFNNNAASHAPASPLVNSAMTSKWVQDDFYGRQHLITEDLRIDYLMLNLRPIVFLSDF